MRALVFGLLVAMTATPLGAQSPAEREKFADLYGSALALEALCGSWRLDRARAAVWLTALNIEEDAFQVGGALHKPFMRASEAAGRLSKTAGRESACDAADLLFGPHGTMLKDWMKPR